MEDSRSESLEIIEDVFNERVGIATDIVSDIFQYVVDEYSRGYKTNEESVYKMAVDWIKYRYPRLMADTLDGVEERGLTFSARELSHSRVGSEESKTGADFMMTLGIHLPDFQTATAVYVQSKAETRKSGYGKSGLGEDSLQMLDYSSDSFVFVFPLGGEISIIPAYSTGGISAADGVIPSDYPESLPSMNLDEFLREFTRGFIGDHNSIPAALHPLAWEEREETIYSLQEYPVDRILQVRIQSSNDDIGEISRRLF